MHTGPPEGQAKVSGGPPPPGPDLPSGGGSRICTLSQCLFLCFPFTKGFSLGLFLVRLALILKML